ncbi:MAG TPA: MEDS domain-containing protein [Caulobacteraceae bacterium]|jgi:hypothetical protein
MSSHLTTCGIPGIGLVPYGIHLCHFYPSRQDLLDGMKPYLLAGVANNERCIWIVSDPLPSSEVEIEIETVPELKRATKTGQLEILDARQWFGVPGTLTASAVVDRCIAEEQRALADDYQGLRIATNTSGVTGQWTRLMECESTVHEQLKTRRIIMCCSYSTDLCRAVEMLEIVRRHDATVERDEDRWQVLLREHRNAVRDKYRYRPPESADGATS